jgi:DNA-binding NtrC family response regulator
MAKILLVDDEAAILGILTDYLQTSGHEVTSVSDSAKAAEMLKAREPFDIMVSDIRMTPVNGMELLKLSRQLNPGMPVILITGFGSRETYEQARQLGAVDCLAKPFVPEALLRTVAKALEKRS